MNPRIERLRGTIEEPLLVTTAVNIRYLAGFESSNAALFVEPDRIRVFSDFRYAERARALAGVEFVETPRNLFVGLANELSGRVAFEAAGVTFAQYDTLGRGGIELVPTLGAVEALRAVKDADELDKIRRAAAVTNEAFARVAEERFVGRTERELAWWFELTLRELGAEAMAFDVTVAAGPTGASPHTSPGDRTIEPNETVVVDAGAIVDGYCSDCTRTFATGDLPGELASAYEVCRRAQESVLPEVTAGAHGRQVDASARSEITEAGFGEQFGHGLGHGLGMLVHEAPYLNQESEDTLQPGNVVTVEPGIYLSGRGGIRIEDLVIVGEDGPEIVTSFPKELTTVG